MNTETIHVEANGLQFAMSRCGSGRKLALLLHGFPESRYSWRHQMPVLAELGFTAWAPDLRGYGDSDRPEGVAAYAMTELLADVAALIDAARTRGMDGPVTLIGHDWGGAIAWYFALLGSRPLERFIVMNLPHPTRFAQGLKTLRQLRRSWYMFFFQLPWLPERLLARHGAAAIAGILRGTAIDKARFPRDVLSVYCRNALRPGALTAMLNYYRAAFRYPPPPRRKFAVPLETPTLMIWGEEDRALGKEFTVDTGALVRDFTLRLLPRVSHFVQQEAPEAVNDIMREWLLTSRPAAGAARDACVIRAG
jgi:pimeloyl-ACP methyl ester carboxylesterase